MDKRYFVTEISKIEMNVTVTFQKQKRIFEVAGEETVLDLKKRIEDWTGVPMAGQKLIVNGFALKDDTAKVSSLGLKEPCKILLVGNVPENEVRIAMKPMEELEKSVLEYPKYCENEELSEDKKNFEFLRIQEELMRIILKLDSLQLNSDLDRAMRKESIVKIQKLLSNLDKYKHPRTQEPSHE